MITKKTLGGKAILFGIYLSLLMVSRPFELVHANQYKINDKETERQKLDYAIQLKNNLYKLANTKGLDKETRITRAAKLLVSEMDIERMAKYSLGRNWRTLGQSDQTRFIKEYKEFLQDNLKISIEEAFSVPSSNIKVIEKVVQMNQKEHEVSFNVKRKNKDGTNFNSILTITVEEKIGTTAKQKEDQWLQVVNISVDRVDILSSHRVLFQSIIEENGMQSVFSLLKDTREETVG